MTDGELVATLRALSESVGELRSEFRQWRAMAVDNQRLPAACIKAEHLRLNMVVGAFRIYGDGAKWRITAARL